MKTKKIDVAVGRVAGAPAATLGIPSLLLAGSLALTAPPASPSGEDVARRRIHIDEVLLPHVEAELTDVFAGETGSENIRYRVGTEFRRWSGTGEIFWRLVGTGSGAWAGMSVGAWATSVSVSVLGGTVMLGPLTGLVVGAFLGRTFITFPTVEYITLASLRAKTDCRFLWDEIPTRACSLESGALYALPLDYFLTDRDGAQESGQCLLFLELDAEEELLNWEADRCVADGFWPGGEPFAQNLEGDGLRTGGRTGFLDGVQGHLDVTARGAVDLDTGDDPVADGGF